MKRNRLVVLLMLVVVMAASCVIPQQNVSAAAWPVNYVLQVQVRVMIEKPRKVYVSKLYVSGTNQNGNSASNTWSQAEWTSQSITAPNWWWNLDSKHGVVVRFYLDGYGWRSCDQVMVLSRGAILDSNTAEIKYYGSNATPKCTIEVL